MKFVEFDVKPDGHCGIRAFYLSLTHNLKWQNNNLFEIMRVRDYLATRGFKKIKTHPVLKFNTSLQKIFKTLKNSNTWLTTEALYALAIKHKVNIKMIYVENDKIIHDEAGIQLDSNYPCIYMSNYNNVHYTSLIPLK